MTGLLPPVTSHATVLPPRHLPGLAAQRGTTMPPPPPSPSPTSPALSSKTASSNTRNPLPQNLACASSGFPPPSGPPSPNTNPPFLFPFPPTNSASATTVTCPVTASSTVAS